MQQDRPLVSILIPTYNRVAQLERAISSATAQSYRPIEIVISDNASTDETESLCRRVAEDHPEVRYCRQPENVGGFANFEWLRAQSRGEFLLFLADDDWIDPAYVSACMAELVGHPQRVLVAGLPVYHALDGTVFLDPHRIHLVGQTPARRVAGYYREVQRNGVFYGVIRASADRKVGRFRKVMAGDWLYVASLALLGEVRSIDGVSVHRSVADPTTTFSDMARGLDLGRAQAIAPRGAIVYWVFREIAFDSPLYQPLGPLRRLRLASRCAFVVGARFTVASIPRTRRLVARLRDLVTGK